MSAPPRRAFTWIELLLLLLIVCVVAALVVPRFTSASTRDTSVQTTLRYLRQQISQFQRQHNGAPPQNGALWTLMQQTSDTAETQVASPQGSALGPYFRGDPVNPWNGATSASLRSVDPAAGWYYSAGTHSYELRIRNADGTINYHY